MSLTPCRRRAALFFVLTVSAPATAGLVAVAASAQTPVFPSKPGDIYIDHHQRTIQLTACRGSGPTAECQIRILKRPDGGPVDSDIWWTLDTMRDSERLAIRQGIGPYAGPPVPLPGAAAARPTGPVRPGPAAPPTASPPAPPPQQTAAPQQAAASGGRCTPATPYTGATPDSRPPSATVFQQVIANKFTMDGTPGYPRRVDYLSFSVGAPIVNSVGMTNQGANRVTNGAPAGVQLYPIKTSFTVCKSEWTKVSRYDSTYFCWRSGGEWACGVSESRVTSRLRSRRRVAALDV